MAKNFKEIEGQIEQINEPRFAKDRRVWVLMVKANGSWRAFVSKDGEKIKAQYELLKSKQIAQSINLSVQATNLSASKVRLAEYAYNQNGLVLPKDSKNLELLLRDVHQKGFLDLELLYQLKEKEAVRDVEKEIADRIANPLEEGTPLFQRVFERCLSS